MTKGKTEKTRYIIPADLYNMVKEFEFPGTRMTGSTVKNYIASKPDKFTDPEGYIILELF